MELNDLTHKCIRYSCIEERVLGVSAEIVDGQVVVRCSKCNNNVKYPAEFLTRTTPALIQEAIGGNFRVSLRCAQQ